MKIKLVDVRLAFPSLWTATAFDATQEAKFSATFIIPPNHPQVAELRDAIKKVAAEKWGQRAPAMLKAFDASGKGLLRNGDAKDYEGFEGNLFLKASNKVQPSVFDTTGEAVTEASGIVYSGCMVSAIFTVKAFDFNGIKGVRAQLTGIKKYADNDAFAGGGRANAADDFDEIGVEAADPLTE
jgi:Protein of unknown function (DUF2815)